jgi:hypothetical protein
MMVPLPFFASAVQDHQHRLETLAWLSKTPIVPLDDLTVRRHDCVTKGQHAGWLRDVADLTHEAISESGSLSGLIATLGRGIPRLPMIFQGPEEVSQAFIGTDQRAGLSKRILPRDELAKLFYWGITVGVVPVERVRLPCRARDDWGAARATRTIRVWEPRQLRFEWASNRWLLETQLGPIDIKDALDEEGRPVFVLWTPYDSGRPWRLAPWRWLSLMAILSRDSVYARARHLQVLSPKRVVTYTDFWSEPQRDKMQEILEASTYNGWLMLPPNTTYQIANVSGNDITNVYQSVIDWARGEAEIGLFGQKVTTEGNKGFSEGDIFRDTAESHIDFYASSAADFLSEAIVDPWVDDCWGTEIGDVGYRWDTESPDRKRQRAEALGKLGASFKQLREGAEAVGLDVDPSDAVRFGREHGIRLVPRQRAEVPNAA